MEAGTTLTDVSALCSLSNTRHKHILRVGEGKDVVGVMDGGGHHTP